MPSADLWNILAILGLFFGSGSGSVCKFTADNGGILINNGSAKFEVRCEGFPGTEYSLELCASENSKDLQFCLEKDGSGCRDWMQDCYTVKGSGISRFGGWLKMTDVGTTCLVSYYRPASGKSRIIVRQNLKVVKQPKESEDDVTWKPCQKDFVTFNLISVMFFCLCTGLTLDTSFFDNFNRSGTSSTP